LTNRLEKGILAIDVGSGTQDILAWRPGISIQNCPKLIMPSATTILAQSIDRATSRGYHIFLSVTTMGGGPCSAAVRNHLKAGLQVFALPDAARTFNDDLEKVRRMGVQVVDERPPVTPLEELPMGDIEIAHIRKALDLFHAPMPGLVAVCVQDHGFSPYESNRAFRFRQWADFLRAGSPLEDLLYETPPDHLTRMRAVTRLVPGAWLMDTGASAILGALLDPWVSERLNEGLTVINAGNEHTLAALVKGERIWGVYEHHTSLLDEQKLMGHLLRFRRGELTNREVFDAWGHGCLVLPEGPATSDFTPVSITGPNRAKFRGLGGHLAAPFGDMMLTGCFGLVEALKRRSDRNG
jgi:uncharacterized protein (DUF1786 family)